MKRIYSSIALYKVILFTIGFSSVFAQDRLQTQNQQDKRRAGNVLRQAQRQAQPEVLYLTPEQEAEVLKYIQATYPDRAERLIKWKDLRPDDFKNALSKAFREMRFMEALKERNPERYARVSEEKLLESQSRELAQMYRQSDDDAEKERLRKEMEDLLNKLFDYRQVNRQDEMDRLEKKLAELKEANQERLENKSEIVERRLRELLGKQKGFEW